MKRYRLALPLFEDTSSMYTLPYSKIGSDPTIPFYHVLTEDDGRVNAVLDLRKCNERPSKVLINMFNHSFEFQMTILRMGMVPSNRKKHEQHHCAQVLPFTEP